MEECIFCKIVDGKVPTEKVDETENVIVIKDINPKAPIHFLIIPKEHIEDIRSDNGVIWVSIGKLATKMAKDKGIRGFRLVHNAGDASLVKHMHVHFLGDVSGGREL